MSAYSFKKRLLLLPTENLKSLESLEELLNTDWKEEKKREPDREGIPCCCPRQSSPTTSNIDKDEEAERDKQK